jgi:hypothetical protein
MKAYAEGVSKDHAIVTSKLDAAEFNIIPRPAFPPGNKPLVPVAQGVRIGLDGDDVQSNWLTWNMVLVIQSVAGYSTQSSRLYFLCFT